jgi:hypothetical protein
MSAEQLAEIYETLNFPSASVFRKALARQGISAGAKDVEEFVSSRTERQVIAPPPKYTGAIVSFDVNQRWMADVISFTSRPVKTNGGVYTYVLIAEDVFSRYVWARPLISLTEVTEKFEEILKESEDRMVDADPHPVRLDTDGGSEFTNAAFKALMVKYKIDHVVKNVDDRNAIATVDRSISTLKRAIARRQASKGGSWLSQLDAAVEGYNRSEHSAINTAPKDMTDDVIFSLKKEAAEDFQENSQMIQSRQDKLSKAGGFRTYIPNKKGLKQRTDAQTWSKEIKDIASFPAPGMVQDASGKQTLTKLTRAVPRDSSAVAPTQAPQPPTALEPYARVIRDFINRPQTFSQAAKEMKRRDPQFTATLKENKMSFKDFITSFPRYFKIHEGRISSVGIQTLG